MEYDGLASFLIGCSCRNTETTLVIANRSILPQHFGIRLRHNARAVETLLRVFQHFLIGLVGNLEGIATIVGH